jgi:hypothetical protein
LVGGLPGPGTFQEHRIHWHSLDQWRGVELLALSFVELGRLQQRYADVVWPDVFHRYGNFYLFRVRVDGTEVWKPVDRCDSSRELQSLVQGIFTPWTRDTGKTAWFIDEFGANFAARCFGIWNLFLV